MADFDASERWNYAQIGADSMCFSADHDKEPEMVARMKVLSAVTYRTAWGARDGVVGEAFPALRERQEPGKVVVARVEGAVG
jgi:hypothetical protein